MRMCKDPVSAQFGLDRLESLAETKLLSYNLKKSMIIILGSKKGRERLTKEFEENPPTLYGVPLQIVQQGSYLGDELHLNSSESISATIRKRSGLVKKSIVEIG